MARQRLTDRLVTSKKPPDAGQLEIWDDLVRGFGIRISYGGKRTFCVMTRINGKQVRRTIGTHPMMTLAEAREGARDVLRDAAKGIDAKEREKQELRQAAIETEGEKTLRDLCVDFMIDHGRRLKTRDEIQRRIDTDLLPALGDVPITEIGRQDIKALHREKAATAPVSANRLLSLIHNLFNYALDEDLVEANPANRIKPEPEPRRERTLRDSEIRDVWRGAMAVGYPYGDLVRFLLLTGQRRAEAAELTWSEIEGDGWRLPGARTKTGEGHLVTLTPLAKSILDNCPRYVGCDYVFTANGEHPMSGWGKRKMRLDAAIHAARRDDDPEAGELSNFTLHDLRRTVATQMQDLGVSDEAIDKVLNHKIGGIRGRYNHSARDPEKAAALTKWARHVGAVVSGDPAASNVVELRAET